jgi:hypothetical protein
MHAQHLREILTMHDVAHRRRETLKVMRVAHRRPIRVEINPRHRLRPFQLLTRKRTPAHKESALAAQRRRSNHV